MTETKTKLRIRKAPKFLPFLLTGAVLGFISALILNTFTVANPGSGGGILGFLIGWLTAIGAGVGIIAALVVELLLNRSAKEVVATKLKK